MRFRRLGAHACTCATPQLALEARPGIAALELQPDPAQRVLSGERAQRSLRAALRCERTVASCQCRRIDVARPDEARHAFLQHEDARFLLAPQRAVVRRQLRLHEHRFAKQRAMQIAQKVEGVKSVSDNLVVKSS